MHHHKMSHALQPCACPVSRYTDQDFDLEFISVLRTQCFNFIKAEGDPTLEDVSAYIHDKVC